MRKPLEGRIALVAGATRGAGRGIAVALGEAGATVWCTGRSVRGASGGRPETIDETAELVTAAGGRGIAVRCDHSDEAQVAALAERVKRESGRLDVLVNDIWGGDRYIEFWVPFWKADLAKARAMFDGGVWTHVITSRYLVPLLFESERGLVVEITDGDGFGYRGMLGYDLVKMSTIRLAWSMSRELKRTRVTSIAVTPGYLRSEEMLERYGVTEANWKDAVNNVPDFIASETPTFVGRAVAALAADRDIAKKNGRVFASWTLAHEYGFTDRDGTRPDWGAHFEKTYGAPSKSADEAAYESWRDGPIEIAFPNMPEESSGV